MPIIVTVAFEGSTEEATLIVATFGSALVEFGAACNLTSFVVPGAFVKKDFIFVKFEVAAFSSFVAGSAVDKISVVEVWTACVSCFDTAWTACVSCFETGSFAENEFVSIKSEAACVSSFVAENDVILTKFVVAWVSSCVDAVAVVTNGIEVVVAAVDFSSISFVGEATVVENAVIVVIAADAGAAVVIAAVDKNAALKVGADVVVVIVVGVIKLGSVLSVLIVVVLVLLLDVVVVAVGAVVVAVVVSFAQHNCPSHPPSVAKCWTGFFSILGSSPMIRNEKNSLLKYFKALFQKRILAPMSKAVVPNHCSGYHKWKTVWQFYFAI